MSRAVPLRHRLEHAAFRVALGVLRALPERWALGVGGALGRLAAALLPSRRRLVDENLARAFPDRDTAWRARVARASWTNLGREAVATFLFAGEPAEQVVARTPDPVGAEAFLSWVAAGNGAVLLTGHFGNWEMAGASAAARGVPLDAVAVRQANRLFDDDLVRARARLGMTVIRRGDAPVEVMGSLRSGRVAGLVADQDARGQGVFVDFLGTPASTARGPALFALRAGVPLFLGSCVAIPGRPGIYRCEVEEVRSERTGDLREDVRRLTAAHAAALAARVRRDPEHYFWQHSRWRTPPPTGV